MNIIECKNLTKEYLSGENTVVALNDVSLEFEKGEFCAITGPSGSGKSTFLHVLSSLENATLGEVIYNNESLKSITIISFQSSEEDASASFFSHITLWKN